MSLEAKLKTARDDLAEAEKSLAAILGGEDAAATTAKQYAEWRSSKADAEVEVARLGKLVSKLTADIETATKAKADQAQAELEVAADRAAEEAKALIIEKLELMHAAARQMMMAIAVSDAKIANANRGRQSDLPPLQGAEARARRGEKLARRVLAERFFEAWSFPGDRQPLSDERAERVVGRGNRGQLRSEAGPHDVIRRRFREVRFLAEVAPENVRTLAETLAIPAIRAGGSAGWEPLPAYAGSAEIMRQLDALAALDGDVDRRRPETTVECIGDAPNEVAA